MLRIAHDLGMKGVVMLYNRQIGTKRTPLAHIRIFGFFTLVNELFDHFKTHKTPVIIDDAVYSYMIFGIKRVFKQKGENNIVLWIADPHKTNKSAGLYNVFLDKDGNQIENSMQLGSGFDSAERIYFNDKSSWLMFLPQRE